MPTLPQDDVVFLIFSSLMVSSINRAFIQFIHHHFCCLNLGSCFFEGNYFKGQNPHCIHPGISLEKQQVFRTGMLINLEGCSPPVYSLK